ncbi:hypothetical protein [Corynebacterium suedekumii]|uniref:Uncharacterized protein n=1 Tax=Corynebacterium suedekumii TaxID=3049801 RepID=A0ABY8VLA8_9CORY|nr:hypothetical protein [Corynebacterium suedekumii]WIM69458.1 hypothetical protein QP029_09370 [Corynebacterium suedekumii]
MNITSATHIADHLRTTQARTLADVASIMHHPRSLARPMPNWRPPSKRLPGVLGAGPLTAAVTRHRVGEQVKARIRGYGEDRQPAYLVTVRVTDPAGGPVDPDLAEGWVRALVDDAVVDAVHEVTVGHAPTFVWLVDSHYQPVHSPASLFTGFAQAA